FERRAPASSRRPGSKPAHAKTILPISTASCLRLYENLFPRNHSPHKPVHQHFRHGPVEILEQPLLQANIGLRSGEQVLHQFAEKRTAPHEMDHSRRHSVEEESSQEDTLRYRSAEFEIGGEVATEQSTISLHLLGQGMRFVE